MNVANSITQTISPLTRFIGLTALLAPTQEGASMIGAVSIAMVAYNGWRQLQDCRSEPIRTEAWRKAFEGAALPIEADPPHIGLSEYRARETKEIEGIIAQGIRKIIVVGPSGSGKTTAIQSLCEKYPQCRRKTVFDMEQRVDAGTVNLIDVSDVKIPNEISTPTRSSSTVFFYPKPLNERQIAEARSLGLNLMIVETPNGKKGIYLRDPWSSLRVNGDWAFGRYESGRYHADPRTEPLLGLLPCFLSRHCSEKPVYSRTIGMRELEDFRKAEKWIQAMVRAANNSSLRIASDKNLHFILFCADRFHDDHFWGFGDIYICSLIHYVRLWQTAQLLIDEDDLLSYLKGAADPDYSFHFFSNQSLPH